MKKRNLTKSRIFQIDGKKRDIVSKDKSNCSHIYSPKHGNHSQALVFKNNLVFYFGYGDQIGHINLKYKEKTVKLIFESGILNTNIDISALPIQNGTFQLTSIACANGKKLPRFDNENRSFCTVEANNWEKLGDEIIQTKEACCEKPPRLGENIDFV